MADRGTSAHLTGSGFKGGRGDWISLAEKVSSGWKAVEKKKKKRGGRSSGDVDGEKHIELKSNLPPARRYDHKKGKWLMEVTYISFYVEDCRTLSLQRLLRKTSSLTLVKDRKAHCTQDLCDRRRAHPGGVRPCRGEAGLNPERSSGEWGLLGKAQVRSVDGNVLRGNIR